jgi:hypothetical protein
MTTAVGFVCQAAADGSADAPVAAAAAAAAAALPVMDIQDMDEDQDGRCALIGQGLNAVPMEAVDPACQVLDLTDNTLRSGAGLDGLVALKTLILDKNRLSQFPADFPVLRQVETLWINNNEFDDRAELLDAIDRLVRGCVCVLWI